MYHINNDKRSLQSAELIFEALQELMKEIEYSQISISDISLKAKVGRATFYRNFDTKDDIIKYKLEEKIQELYKYLFNYAKNEDNSTLWMGLHENSTHMEEFFVLSILKFWYVDSKIIELLIKANKINIFQESIIKMNITLLTKLGIIDDLPPLFIKYHIPVRTSALTSLLVQWIKNDKKDNPEELSRIIVNGFELVKNSLIKLLG